MIFRSRSQVGAALMNDASHKVLVILLLEQCEFYNALQSQERLHQDDCAARCCRFKQKVLGFDTADAVFSLTASVLWHSPAAVSRPRR